MLIALMVLIAFPASGVELNERGYVCQTVSSDRDTSVWLVRLEELGAGSTEWQVAFLFDSEIWTLFANGECEVGESDGWLRCIDWSLGPTYLNLNPETLRFTQGFPGIYLLMAPTTESSRRTLPPGIVIAPEDVTSPTDVYGITEHGTCSPL